MFDLLVYTLLTILVVALAAGIWGGPQWGGDK